MKFEQWWEFNGEAATQTADLPLVPDGNHVAKIVNAQWKDLTFKADDRNPDGTSLVVKLEVTGHAQIEAIAPVTWRGMIEAICRSASQPLPKLDEDWDCRTLKGQYCRISTVQGVSKNGREYVRVERWHEGREPLPEAIRKTPPRSKAAKPELPDDDIPF